MGEMNWVNIVLEFVGNRPLCDFYREICLVSDHVTTVAHAAMCGLANCDLVFVYSAATVELSSGKPHETNR